MPNPSNLEISTTYQCMQIEPWIADRDTPTPSHSDHLTLHIAMLQGMLPLFLSILST